MAVSLEFSVINTAAETATEPMLFAFGANGGSIGRADTNDCVLIDHNRLISGNHARVDFEQGQFYLTDTSTNGCWLKGQAAPIGKGNRVCISGGEVVVIGHYEFCFHTPDTLASAAGTDDLLNQISGDDPMASLDFPLDEPSPTSNTPVDYNVNVSSPSEVGLGEQAEGISPASILDELDLAQPKHGKHDKHGIDDKQANMPISDLPLSDGAEQALDGYFEPAKPSNERIPTDWNISLLTKDKEAATKPATEPASNQPPPIPDFQADNQASNPVNEPNPWQKTDNAPLQSDAKSQVKPSTEDHKRSQSEPAFTTLYSGLELANELRSQVDEQAFVEDSAEIIKEAVTGIMGLLKGRTVFKEESRLALTAIKPRSNNPLKFSIDAQEALETLLVRKKTAYLGASEAISEACHDVQVHQLAFLAGLQAALQSVLTSLSPEVIKEKTKSPNNKLLNIMPSARYWETFQTEHQKLSKAINENLQDILGKEFAEAYQRQVSNLKQDK
ncbi:type VI secretion system-associated FHA domain protein TagH [Thalassotalea euphylliae]|uniref:Type VI secretion system-associated FHA domain protein TagH n=1 Tax=Thalassotalea euphylliae TaxID=1655234 RepID=A0A3E0TT17_9GAMM|nr:type VI secretion system-associated FHA domain protein TagH [Thalassotalea euphylliae]REL27678.1 type VI secretion system-associated FHA domain protein TagH [Thalassotalea euphylliae]